MASLARVMGPSAGPGAVAAPRGPEAQRPRGRILRSSGPRRCLFAPYPERGAPQPDSPHKRRRPSHLNVARQSQSRLSRSRLDPAWSLQECRWAPCVRSHDSGQGQLPCESYRPPGQLLETHPAALLADTYALFRKNQSTSERPPACVRKLHGGASQHRPCACCGRAPSNRLCFVCCRGAAWATPARNLGSCGPTFSTTLMWCRYVGKARHVEARRCSTPAVWQQGPGALFPRLMAAGQGCLATDGDGASPHHAPLDRSRQSSARPRSGLQ